MDINLIISPLVGALIAGTSNRIAIKMLFFPAKPLYIMGLRLPFTPGIIPKERVRIAESIGNTAGRHILNEESIVNVLSSEDIQCKVKKSICSFFINLQNSDMTIKEYLKKLSINTREASMDNVKKSLTTFLLSRVGSEHAINTVRQSFSLYRFINSDRFSEFVKDILRKIVDAVGSNTARLDSIIADEDIISIKKYMFDHSADICSIIKKYVSDPDIAGKLGKYIDSSMSRSIIGKIILKLVDSNRIYSYIHDELNKFLDSREGRLQAAKVLEHFVDRLSGMRLCDIGEQLHLKENEHIIESACTILLKRLATPENMTDIHEKLDQYILQFIHTCSADPGFTKLCKDIVSRVIDLALDSKVSAVFTLDEEKICAVQDCVLKFIKESAENYAGSIIEFIDIPKIVRERLNQFDIEHMEEIILHIVKKDLWMLTFLEATLGFIIGFIAPLLSYLFRLI